ncbi:MAG: ATP-dependent DNA helicase RecG [Planctomycetota bacterium]
MAESQSLRPEDPLTALPGIGKARAEALGKAGFLTLRDLVLTPPLGLLEWPAPISIREALALSGERVRIAGTLREQRLTRFGGRKSRVRWVVEDSSGTSIRAHWFHMPWMTELVPTGSEVELYGPRAEGNEPILANPQVGYGDKPLPAPGSIVPRYAPPQGFREEYFGGLVRSALDAIAVNLRDPLPPEALARHDLPELARAARGVHEPTGRADFEASRRRLALEPLLRIQAGLQQRRAGRGGGARALRLERDVLAEIAGRFPYRFTEAQRDVLRDILRDLARRIPMRRLVQGDVGSGKTAVALYAAMAVVEGGGQAAFMAPTELLAEQHFYGARRILREQGIEVELLTGSVKTADRRYMLERVSRGEVQVLFGTHALFSKDVRFGRLDLVVIDEQHRFGVMQRASLADKGSDPHLLLLTATPIPRTLALTLYGDLEVSSMDASPPGRGGIRTQWSRGQALRKVRPFLEARLDAGDQVYWVLPRIGGGEEGSKGVLERFDDFCKDPKLARFGIECVHGKLPPEERAWRLDRFRNGDVGLLVATTVVEVGVDVPNATVMVIEDAHRLGLAQLHQLRGRVGRGPKDSFCILIGDKAAEQRLQTLERSRDGFFLAEEDLRKRGMGDLAGLRQAGFNTEGLADPESDLDLFLAARDLVQSRPAVLAHYAGLGGLTLAP